MDNEEYAELLEKVAARLRKLEEPISQKTISAIGEVSRCIIKEGKKTTELSDTSVNEIKDSQNSDARAL